jgi:hypothetical protein
MRAVIRQDEWRRPRIQCVNYPAAGELDYGNYACAAFDLDHVAQREGLEIALLRALVESERVHGD